MFLIFSIIMLEYEQSFNPFLYNVNVVYVDGTRLVDLKGLHIVI
jgi:hypothetical protein